MLLTANNNSVTYPVLIIEVEGIKWKALIATGAGSAYASSSLINKVNTKPCHKECKRIETLMNSVVRKTDVYQCEIRDANREFKIKIELSKLDKEVLLDLPNPKY